MDQTEKNDRPSPSVQDAVRNQFDPVAANYASSTVHAQGDEFSAMLELVALAGDEDVLDAGCGPGHTALTFAPYVRSVLGVDLSASMLAQGRRLAAEQKLTNVEFKEADVQSLPLADASFDLIVSRYSAHHWPDPVRALAEFRRVLKPGHDRAARLLLADVVTFADPVTDTHFQAIELLRDASHVRDHRTDEWLQMMASAGFDARVSMQWDLWIDFDSWIQRMHTPAARAEQIRAILAAAPEAVQSNLRVEDDSSFTMRCALFSAVPDHNLPA